MKVKLNRVSNHQSGFTLIEMIGVLAVIAILAAVLIPKVFEAINNARVNSAAMSCSTVKAAVVDHYGKFGSLTSSNGVALTSSSSPTLAAVGAGEFDKVLLAEGFLDKPFATRLGGSADDDHKVNLIQPAAAVAVTGGAYDLDGVASTTDTPTTSYVVEAVIYGATESDAKDLNDRIDGTALGIGTGAADLKGRVKYTAASVGTEGIFVYITHR